MKWHRWGLHRGGLKGFCSPPRGWHDLMHLLSHLELRVCKVRFEPGKLSCPELPTRAHSWLVDCVRIYRGSPTRCCP